MELLRSLRTKTLWTLIAIPVVAIVWDLSSSLWSTRGLAGFLADPAKVATTACCILMALVAVWNLYRISRPRIVADISPPVIALLCQVTVLFLGTLPPALSPLLFLAGLGDILFSGVYLLSLILTCISFAAAAAMQWGANRPEAAVLSVAVGASAVAGVMVGRRIHKELTEQGRLAVQSVVASAEISRANTLLQDEVQRTDEKSRSRERMRIAREIHDTIGHALTGVIMQISACQDELRRDKGAVGERLAALEGIVRNAILEVRREVTSLRTELEREGNWMDSWESLCRIFFQATGVRVQTAFEGDFSGIDARTGESVYRIIQEGLTNALRHGSATLVDVSAGVFDGRLLVRISDDGAGAERIVAGNGLTGMRERVRDLEGDITFSSEAGKGFDIGVDLPHRAAG